MRLNIQKATRICDKIECDLNIWLDTFIYLKTYIWRNDILNVVHDVGKFSGDWLH